MGEVARLPERPEDPREVLRGFTVAAIEREEAIRGRLEANLGAAEAAMRAARRKPWVQGSTGQLVPHPGFPVAAACDEVALRLYRELTAGLDELAAQIGAFLRDERRPRPRLRLGCNSPCAEPHAADRLAPFPWTGAELTARAPGRPPSRPASAHPSIPRR